MDTCPIGQAYRSKEEEGLVAGTRHVEAVEAGDEDCALDRWGDVGEQIFVIVLEEEGCCSEEEKCPR
jgi:hypothetical protein